MERPSKESELVFDIIVRNYSRLEDLNQNHALLGYLQDVSPKGFSWNQRKFDEFLGKFSIPTETGLDITALLINYSTALRDAIVEEAVLVSRKLKRLSPDYKE